MSYSKKLVLISYITTALLTIASVLCVFFVEGGDTSPLLTVTGLSWAETAACNAFYFWKAKNENRIKLTKKMVEDLADKHGIEAVVSLAEIILKD